MLISTWWRVTFSINSTLWQIAWKKWNQIKICNTKIQNLFLTKNFTMFIRIFYILTELSTTLILFFNLNNQWKHGTLGVVGLWLLLVRSIRNTHICGKVFAHYEPGRSPILVLVAAAVTCYQSGRIINFSHCTTPTHNLTYPLLWKM